MKKTITISLLLFGMAAAAQQQNRQTTVSQPAKEAIEIKETSHDFGKIPQGRPVTYNFEVKNTGKKPLLIENVQAACGCTTPEWSQEPVAPGASTQIKVGFNAAAEGHFSKSITIIYNNNQTKGLTITGDVFPMPATSAPLNTSLSSIK